MSALPFIRSAVKEIGSGGEVYSFGTVKADE